MESSFVLQDEVRLLQSEASEYYIENEIDIESNTEQELAAALNSKFAPHVDTFMATLFNPL
jgi:hypothetical protein